MASGALTIRHLLGLATVLCLACATSSGVFAQRAASPDAVAIIQEFSTTGRTDYRFRSRDEAQAFIKAWPAGVERWAGAGESGQSERSGHLAALAALEFSRTAFHALGTQGGGGQELLIEAAHSSLRRRRPSEFERQWLRATTGLLAASRSYSHLTAAVDRFPHDPRLRLNEVLADGDAGTLGPTPGTSSSDLLFSLGSGDKDGFGGKKVRHVGRAEGVFTDLLTDPEVGAEATARLAWLRFHQNRLVESRELFERAGSATGDPFVRNLAGLGLGVTHLAAGRNDDATAAFRTAASAMPTARAATTALAMQLFLAGERQAASDLLDRLAGVPNKRDPWIHVTGADRFLDGILRELRADLGVPSRVVPVAVPVIEASRAPAVPAAPVPIAGVSTAPPDSRQTRPMFTAATSIVAVDAAVLNGRRSVDGLIASDFEIRDNGVVQTIDGVSVEGLPLDVTVVLDLRDPTYAIFLKTGSTVVQDATSQGVADTAQFSALLRPDDRLRIVTATRDVSEPHPLQGPGGRAVYRVPREQMAAAALHDAIFTALARRTPPERRHLVLVFTDGPDGASIITSRQLLQAAGKSDALVQVFRRDTADEFFARPRTQTNSDSISRFLLWPHDPLLLPALAEATSGSLERVSSNGQSVVADVKHTLDSFRQRYILRYRPTGVAPGGWHNIAVRVNRPGNLTVQARRGYDGG
jgi:hypothetical protein